MRTLKVYNPHGLPTIPYNQLEDFQGDLKLDIKPSLLEKLKNSLKKHGVFVPKFVWIDRKQVKIIDGHQTKQALASLEEDGWEIPEIPYVTITAKNQKDAAEKLLQLNSKYAEYNPNTKWFDGLEFSEESLSEMLSIVEIPEIDIEELLSPVFFNISDRSNQLGINPSEGISPTEDQAMLSRPLDSFEKEDELQGNKGRIILIYTDAEQKKWIEQTLNMEIRKVVYPVSEIKDF